MSRDMGVKMEIIRKSLGGVPLLEICEDIDHSTAEEFHQAVHDALDERRRLLLDLSGCRYVDSGGLAVILATTKELGGGGWLGVVGGTRNVSRLFHLVGLDAEPAFCQFSDLAAAERTLAAD
jgi:anti-anti-sigma factor